MRKVNDMKKKEKITWKANKKWIVDDASSIKPLPKPNFIDRFRFRLWKRHDKFLKEALEKLT